MNQAIESLIRRLPKVELHLHIEGSLEPELMFSLARRNQVPLPYASVEALRAAYDFSNLQSFLDLYYAGASVLLEEQDFFDLTWAYLQRASADGIVHTEIFFDPQTHTMRGVPFEVVLRGIRRALALAQDQLGISSRLIMSFLRHLSEDDGFEVLELARPFLSGIDGFGLDSSEMGHPPEKFTRLFAECRRLGLPCVAHAGEEGPADYVRQALDLLQVCRIDHGVRVLEDPALVARLALQRMPLTVCPLSNVRLRVFDHLSQHNLPLLLEAGLLVSIHSDDPAYFGGYLQDNFMACAEALDLSVSQIVELACNAFEASWLPAQEKERWVAECQKLAVGVE
jgi:adenosine deaminase